MNQTSKLPIFYQNLNEKNVNQLEEDTKKSFGKKINEKDKRRNYLQIDFYQTKYHKPSVYYKPISKTYIFE